MLLCTNLAASDINMQDWGPVEQRLLWLFHYSLGVPRINGDYVSQHVPDSPFIRYFDFLKVFMLPAGPLTSFPVCSSKSMIIWPFNFISSISTKKTQHLAFLQLKLSRDMYLRNTAKCRFSINFSLTLFFKSWLQNFRPGDQNLNELNACPF